MSLLKTTLSALHPLRQARRMSSFAWKYTSKAFQTGRREALVTASWAEIPSWVEVFFATASDKKKGFSASRRHIRARSSFSNSSLEGAGKNLPNWNRSSSKESSFL